MHKKKALSTKLLVRNPERPKPKVTLINHYINEPPQPEKHENTSEKPSTSESSVSKIRFKSPEPNSALLLAQKIKSLENLKPQKKNEKLAVDEKVLFKLI